jgi:hypothetical protein
VEPLDGIQRDPGALRVLQRPLLRTPHTNQLSPFLVGQLDPVPAGRAIAT